MNVYTVSVRSYHKCCWSVAMYYVVMYVVWIFSGREARAGSLCAVV